uniref:DUF4412 domain-containing protein n=1 Tax=uncultured Draconibacterium sp. TaxID=1573823 RepID=UPI0032172D1C
MKIITRLSLLTLLSVILIQPVNGQKLLKNIKKRVLEQTEKKIEDKAVEKANKEVDETIDKAFEKEEEQQNDKDESTINMAGILGKMGMSSEPVPVEDTYSFNQKIHMNLVSYDKNGKVENEGEFITHLDNDTKSMAYEVISGDMAQTNQGLIIIDAKNKAMILLGNEKDQKSGIVYGMNAFFQSIGETYEDDIEMEETPDTYLANPNVKKTGKTRTISGYKCEEYLYNDESLKSEMWITKDLKMNSQDFFGSLFKISSYSSGVAWGYLMESTSENKETGEKTVMKVTDIDLNSKTRFSLNDYEITNLGNLNIPTTGTNE